MRNLQLGELKKLDQFTQLPKGRTGDTNPGLSNSKTQDLNQHLFEIDTAYFNIHRLKIISTFHKRAQWLGYTECSWDIQQSPVLYLTPRHCVHEWAWAQPTTPSQGQDGQLRSWLMNKSCEVTPTFASLWGQKKKKWTLKEDNSLSYWQMLKGAYLSK